MTRAFVLERIERVNAARREAVAEGEPVLVDLYTRMLDGWRSILLSLPAQKETDG